MSSPSSTDMNTPETTDMNTPQTTDMNTPQTTDTLEETIEAVKKRKYKKTKYLFQSYEILHNYADREVQREKERLEKAEQMHSEKNEFVQIFN